MYIIPMTIKTYKELLNNGNLNIDAIFNKNALYNSLSTFDKIKYNEFLFKFKVNTFHKQDIFPIKVDLRLDDMYSTIKEKVKKELEEIESYSFLEKIDKIDNREVYIMVFEKLGYVNNNGALYKKMAKDIEDDFENMDYVPGFLLQYI